MRLREALEQTPTATLRRVASAHGLAHDDSTTRDELIQRLTERLLDTAYLTERVHGLTAEERSVLASAHASAGELRGLLVDSEHPRAAEDLADRGWLFRVFAAAGPLRGEVFVVPDELLELLPADEPPRLQPDVEPPPEPRWTDPAFSLFALASALTRTPAAHLERDVRAWSEEPGGWSWDARWTFLQHIALGAGLLTHRADGVLSTGVTLPRLLDDRPAVADRLWRSYLHDRGWSELHRAGIRRISEQSAEIADTLGLRRALVEAIEQLPLAEWLSLEALSAWLERTRPTLVREQLTPRGLALLQAADWSELEQPVLRYVLLGPLYWLGVVAASRDGLRLSRRDRSREGNPAEACRWEDSDELIAPARARLGALLQAERYLVLRARGRVSRYHLVQAHAAAALSAGGSLAECRQLLTDLTQTGLPPTVEERLSTWEQRFGALEIRPAVLLEARRATELDAAIADEQVRPFIRARLGALAAEVAAADALELASALRGSGHLPRIDAALRLAAEPRQAFAGLVDEQVLEFLLVSLLAFRTAWPERLGELEGSTALLERLEHQFAAERLAELRAAAERLARRLSSRVPRPPPPPRRSRGARRKPSPGKL